VAFAMNYWQITASRVQNHAPGQPASRPAGPKGDAPVQPQASLGLAGGLNGGRAGKKTSDAQLGAPGQQETKQEEGLNSCLRFEDLYTQPPDQWPGARRSDTSGSKNGLTPGADLLSDKMTRMLQASPNLTMAQMKAILKVERFE
jgi:hypothetical protein